jgi:hypothetical protein
MVILAVLIVLLAILLASTWSSARSYFARGRLRGIEEATLEIIRGIDSHYQTAGQAPPDHLTKAVEAVRAIARGVACEKSIDRTHARLWIFGDAVGAACWRKGYDACKQEMAPAPDKIRVELSMGELLHLSWLAHLGFRRMMPNDRGIEMRRFNGEDDAREGNRAIERLELAIPARYRPFDDPVAQSVSRHELIEHWWPLQRRSA